MDNVVHSRMQRQTPLPFESLESLKSRDRFLSAAESTRDTLGLEQIRR